MKPALNHVVSAFVLSWFPLHTLADTCACGGPPCDLTIAAYTAIIADTEFTACQNLSVEPGVTVDPEVELVLNAGVSVEISPEFSALETSLLSVNIDPDLACVENADGDDYNQCMDCNDGDPQIYPGAYDPPDGNFTDQNCDGIDGDIEGAVFVAANGKDQLGCGTPQSPCATISNGLARASELERQAVYVQQGQYNEVIDVRDGISIYGGFDGNWYRPSASGTVVWGGQHSGDNSYTVFRARHVTATLADMVLNAPNASGTETGGARGSYAVHAVNSNLALQRLAISQGNGAIGTSGSAGTDASLTPPSAGADGAAGAEFASSCDDTTRKPGGAGATNPGCGGESGGGMGGAGGKIDTDCDGIIGEYAATPGLSGQNADVYQSGSYGYRGVAGATCRGAPPGRGNDGRVIDGSGGDTGRNNGFIGDDDYWYAFAGGTGSLGEGGTGGGGGGGSGGCDEDIDDLGAGGGGGGAGGCKAVAGGAGGSGGGGSFGVFAVSGSLDISNVSISRGSGGSGGSGGRGGQGQPGGPGGNGGAASEDTHPGGSGGDGARGGHAGAGGGGAGGSVYCVFHYASSVTETTLTCLGGMTGTGGSGGYGFGVNQVEGRDGESGTIGTTEECLVKGDCGK